MIKTCMSSVDFKKILSNYDLGAYLSHEFKDVTNSHIYFVKTSMCEVVVKVPKDVLKEKKLEHEFKITDYLNSKNVKVQTLYKKKDGCLLLNYKTKRLAIYSFIKGKTLPDDYIKKVYKSVAKNIGILHKELLELKIKDIGYTHCSIDKFLKMGEQKYFNKKQKQDYNNLVKEIKKLKNCKLSDIEITNIK